MIERIKNWFQNDCPYLEGITIYQRIGGPYNVSIFTNYLQANYVPDHIQERLQHAITTYYENNFQTTTEELQNESDQYKQITKSEAPQSFNPSTSQSLNQSEPKQIKDLREKAKPLHKLHSLTFFKMQRSTTDEERHEHAITIMTDLIPKIDGIYNQIRHWQESGELPSDNASNDLVQETIKKMNKINSLNSRISRLKGLLRKATNQTYQQELLEKQIELEELKQDLGIK